MNFGTILVLGDSIMYGARQPLGPPELLAGDVGGTEWAVLNRSISGQTTREILARTPEAIAELAAMAGPKWVVVLAGTNDSKGAGLDLGIWLLLYRQLLHWPRRQGYPLALCTFPPVVPARMPAYTSASQRWLVRASELVRDEAIALASRGETVRLVELSDVPVKHLLDGVHLNRDGIHEVAGRLHRAMLA